MDAIETRVAHLERSMRRWRAGSAVAFCAAVVAACWGAAKPAGLPAKAQFIPEIDTNRLNLVAPDGKSLATFSANQDGTSLTMIGAGEKAWGLTFQADTNETAIAIADEKSVPRLLLGAKAGESFIVVRDPRGRVVWESPKPKK
jgi:hypothetical protein